MDSRISGSGETGAAVEESTSILTIKELAMTAVRQYSTYFSCLYDEPRPVGSLGRGTHYSVFRSVEWLDVQRRRLPIPHVHDFAVIWDQDHDERVIDAIERIYLAGLLSPVQFIGERKGGLTAIVASLHYWAPRNEADAYKRALEAIGQSLDDPWPVEIGCFDRRSGSPQNRSFEGIISAAENKVELYLANIDSLWELGTRPFVPRTSAWTSPPALASQPYIPPPLSVPQAFPPGGVLPPST
jgi:hypothetical protein